MKLLSVPVKQIISGHRNVPNAEFPREQIFSTLRTLAILCRGGRSGVGRISSHRAFVEWGVDLSGMGDFENFQFEEGDGGFACNLNVKFKCKTD